MIGSFNFEDGGRTYTCSVEQPRAGRVDAWWWFQVSGDTHRYAPFQAAPDDTQDSVRRRIVEYYDDLLVRRSQPATTRPHWARRGKGTTPAASTAGATPAASTESTPTAPGK